MTSERLGNVDLTGVSRVWQTWHNFDGGRKSCLAKLKSLFTVSFTSILCPVHS